MSRGKIRPNKEDLIDMQVIDGVYVNIMKDAYVKELEDYCNHLESNQPDHSILIKAIEKWGAEVQINKIQEEALELALILNQRNCPTKNKATSEHRLYDELADMKIMMVQADILFIHERIKSQMRLKINKLNEKYLQ